MTIPFIMLYVAMQHTSMSGGSVMRGTVTMNGHHHDVTLIWDDTVNPGGTTYNVYRAPGACSGSPVFTQINSSAVTSLSYVDNKVVHNASYCYEVTAFNVTESTASNTADATIP